MTELKKELNGCEIYADILENERRMI